MTSSENYFSQVYRYKFGQKCHLWGKFGQNRSFLVKIGSFWGQKLCQMSKFGEIGQTIFSLKVSKNFNIFGENCH